MSSFRSVLICLLSAVMLMATFTTGCQYKVPLMPAPVEVTGKLTKGGQPFGDVILMLQPLQTGHPVPLTVKPDGSFKGSIVPGKYAYYITPVESSSAIDSVDASFKEASMSRTVTIEPGQSQLDVGI